ncbi:MAG TPA: type II toxin-antitoxin system HipA family toxin [Aeromicrobium sp.]|nr:type II toxin-antitoxin system HipA family toxin [Aeromicrobium sp.]
MTDSERVFVWTWLPGQVEPVVAGALERRGDRQVFYYAESYRSRLDAIDLYTPELPLRAGFIEPKGSLTLAGCLKDGTPDSWGRRVIESRLGAGESNLLEEEYMLLSGSNRFGAIDFQRSPTEYVSRAETASLDELHEAADRLESGQPLSPVMQEALLRGTSIGGARPKVLVEDGHGVQWIAKLSSTSDRVFHVVNAEGAAMELARRAGLRVPETVVTESLGRDVLLVRRFDREPDGCRHHVVSALTMSGEDEMGARYVTYPSVLEVLRRYTAPGDTGVGRELFERIAFNIAISNSDDHARNHAALWDGKHLTLSPAYDLAPGLRSGDSSEQAMWFDAKGTHRRSNFAELVSFAHEYDLTVVEARGVIDGLVESIHENWDESVEISRLSDADAKHLWHRQILPASAFYDYGPRPSSG